MDYPKEFSREAKARVEGARIEAKRVLMLTKNVGISPANPGGPALDYVCAIFHAYAKEACALGSLGVWDVDYVIKYITRVTESLAFEADRECGDLTVRVPIPLLSGSGPSREFWVCLKKSVQWWAYQKWLADVAASQSSNPDPLIELKTAVIEMKQIVAAEATEGHPLPKTISERLDEAAAKEDISHEEQAARINISRTAYFQVKAGRGGKKSRKRAELYLNSVFNKIDT
jgi:hypothetical protein